MLNNFQWAKTEEFKFIGEFDRFEANVDNKTVERKLFHVSGFKNGLLLLSLNDEQ